MICSECEGTGWTCATCGDSGTECACVEPEAMDCQACQGDGCEPDDDDGIDPLEELGEDDGYLGDDED
jgi:hypothetical protein